MYKTLLVPADNETTAEKEVNTLFTSLGLFTWQIKGFGPVHDKEAEYQPKLPQYKVIVLLTADQVEKFTLPKKITGTEVVKELLKLPVKGFKKPAAPAKKAKVKKPAALAKKPAEKKPAALAKKPVESLKDKPSK